MNDQKDKNWNTFVRFQTLSRVNWQQMCFSIQKKLSQWKNILWLFSEDQIKVFEGLGEEIWIHLIWMTRIEAVTVCFQWVDILDNSITTVNTCVPTQRSENRPSPLTILLIARHVKHVEQRLNSLRSQQISSLVSLITATKTTQKPKNKSSTDFQMHKHFPLTNTADQKRH